ncbi:MAG: adenylosuccinate synthase [Ignavibacteriae bacterium]|nr:adenylosuccinate synthase [Ignavibacteria bacterium]MBI3364684.1 adenylosuccinate synthase [Ignavibacteriota bacterium]
MPVQIVVGAQWGDEGKGKIVDHLSENVDIVARYQGGANAGHTVVIGETEHILHLIPSGIFHPHVTCVIGNGVVVDPIALLDEINQLKQLNINISGRLLISHNAHLIMPYHKLLDTMREQTSEKIGTTGRGIGPAYIDKFMRVGIRIVDLLDRDVFVSKLKRNIEEKNQILKRIYGTTELDVDKIVCEYEEFDKKIDEYVTDTALYLNNELKENKRILAEGAQGALLDVDHGTYPYVTSSNPTSGGACTGLGIPPTSIVSILGIIKAYSTRVGNGPFPTEQQNKIGDRLREIGTEYGATTGRPRRCGWFDAVSVRYSAMVNGIDEIAITKLDVLDSFETIQVCTDYMLDGKSVKSFPSDVRRLDAVVPRYETFEGWKTSTAEARTYDALPTNARAYVDAIGKLTEANVRMVSVGARRDQTIVVH